MRTESPYDKISALDSCLERDKQILALYKMMLISLCYVYLSFTTEPSPPGQLRAFNPTPVSVDLSWVPADNTFNSYDIFYSIGAGGTPVLAGNVDGTENTFTVEGLDPGTSYSFSVYTVSGSDATGDRVISTPAVTTGSTGKMVLQVRRKL